MEEDESLVEEDESSIQKQRYKEKDFDMKIWDPIEDQLLFSSRSKYGNKWKKISIIFNNNGYIRSSAMIRNRYIRITNGQKEVEKRDIQKKSNLCAKCGQIRKGHTCPQIYSLEYLNTKELFKHSLQCKNINCNIYCSDLHPNLKDCSSAKLIIRTLINEYNQTSETIEDKLSWLEKQAKKYF